MDTDKSSAESAGLSSLEQVNATICNAPNRPFLKGVNVPEQKAIIFKPRCKSWSCPACSEINKRLWAVKAFHGASVIEESHGKPDFLTITSHESLKPEQSLYVWPKAWSKLSQRARRIAKDFQYLLIPEQHKDGRLHVHAIETAGLGSRWWKDNARACGLGYMAEEEKLRTAGGAAYYVVKYLTKSLETGVWPKGFRRVRTSQKWPKLPAPPPPDGWVFAPLSKDADVSDEARHLEDMGYDVLILDHEEAWQVIKFIDEGDEA